MLIRDKWESKNTYTLAKTTNLQIFQYISFYDTSYGYVYILSHNARKKIIYQTPEEDNCFRNGTSCLQRRILVRLP